MGWRRKEGKEKWSNRKPLGSIRHASRQRTADAGEWELWLRIIFCLREWDAKRYDTNSCSCLAIQRSTTVYQYSEGCWHRVHTYHITDIYPTRHTRQFVVMLFARNRCFDLFVCLLFLSTRSVRMMWLRNPNGKSGNREGKTINQWISPMNNK